jgi:hypothetical protein
MHPAFSTCRLFDAQCRMHHDDEDNADALGNIDPVDPFAATRYPHISLPPH